MIPGAIVNYPFTDIRHMISKPFKPSGDEHQGCCLVELRHILHHEGEHLTVYLVT
jgi:hypothetical protein